MKDNALFTLQQARTWHQLLDRGDIELRIKAAGAFVRSDTPEEALNGLIECEQGHIPGDCVLCGAR